MLVGIHFFVCSLRAQEDIGPSFLEGLVVVHVLIFCLIEGF